MAEEAYVSEGRPIDTQWNQICSQLKMEFGETAFDSWLKPLTVGDFSKGNEYLRSDGFYEKLGCNSLFGSNQ